MSCPRRPVYFNPEAKAWTAAPSSPETSSSVRDLHNRLDGFSSTRLVELKELADELGVRKVFVKDESSRIGLPSFKILGASWGTYLAIVERIGLSLDDGLQRVGQAARSQGIKLFAATDGNHGRAVARMGSILSIPSEIYVPDGMHPSTAAVISGEGATVVMTGMSYDMAIVKAKEASCQPGGLLIQDCALEGYEDIPRWIVDGYSTMMHEIDDQLQGENVDLVVTPVGVGSFAQAVVSHFKREGRKTSVLAVEPDTAACLWKSLCRGGLVKEETKPSIMAGLECGTVSSIAWPILQAGIDASVTVSDYEAHQATLDLKTLGVDAGPCGAATLAALRRLKDSDQAHLGLSKDSVIVVLSTEGPREYDVPRDTSIDDAASLTQILVQINSVNPGLDSTSGPGEDAIARYVASWFEHRDISAHWIEPARGRPSVVAVAEGSGGGKSLMVNGHIDTVSVTGYNDPFSGKIVDGKLYGRGAADMKGGVAAAMLAVARARTMGLRGDVLFAGVADEEAQSIGTEQLLAAGWRADAAVVSEPTNLDIIYAHKGFVWLNIDIHGVASHGSRPDLGKDAITHAGFFLVELSHYNDRLQQAGNEAERLMRPSVHASIIQGGVEESSYPALCSVAFERRTVQGETPEMVENEVREILDGLKRRIPGFVYDLRVTFRRPQFHISPEDPFAALAGTVIGKCLGKDPTFLKFPAWTDCALLSEAGIPSILWGPIGEGLHARTEWVEVESIEKVAEGLTSIASEFCK